MTDKTSHKDAPDPAAPTLSGPEPAAPDPAAPTPSGLEPAASQLGEPVAPQSNAPDSCAAQLNTPAVPPITVEDSDTPIDNPGSDTSDPDTLGSNQEEAPKTSQLTTADKMKFFGLIGFVLVTTLIGVYIVRFVLQIESTENFADALTTAIRDAGIWGIMLCLGLQLLQVVVAFIPGEIVQAAIGLVYGTVWGGLITLSGSLLASICVFYLSRQLGAPFVQGMLGKSEGKRIAAIERFFSNSRRLNATVFILFLIPGMPKDIFTYLVPLTHMRPSEFFVLSTIARAPAIFATTFVADAFASENYLACVIVAIIFGGLGLVGIIFNMKIMEIVDKIIDKLHPHHEQPGDD